MQYAPSGSHCYLFSQPACLSSFHQHRSNCETGEIISAVNREQHRSVVPHLNLTQQQLQNISAGIPVFKRLLEPVVRELKKLQQEELGGGISGSSIALDSNTGNPASSLGDASAADPAAAAAGAAAAGEGGAGAQADAYPASGQRAAAEPDVAESFTHFKALCLQQRRARWACTAG
jgi:hypothetical protein